MKVIIVSNKGGNTTRETTLIDDDAVRFIAWIKDASVVPFETGIFENSSGERFYVMLLKQSIVDVCVFHQ